MYNLRVKLQERRNRLHKIKYQHYITELQLFLEFLKENPHLKALVTKLEQNEAIDFNDWKKAQIRNVNFPTSETVRATLCYYILKECAADSSPDQVLNWAQRFSNETQLDDMLNDFNETVLDVLWRFFDDQIDEAGDVLYLLERFKLKTEWFHKEELWGTYKGDTTTGERNLDRKLREALFDGGIDFPFSEPTSPSGKADIVALSNMQDPLVLEVKVYDPQKSKDKSHLRKGFHQVRRYANDYQQAVGYLVIFNCSNNQLVLPSDNSDEGEFPPRIVHDSKTLFLISVDISSDRDSASRENPKNRIEVTRSELIA